MAEGQSQRVTKQAIFFLVALPILLAARPVFQGAAIVDIARVLAFEIVFAIVPGWFAWRCFRTRASDWLLDLGASWAIGHVLLSLVSVGLAITGARSLVVAFPLLVIACGWLVHRLARPALDARSERPAPSTIEIAGLVLLVVIAVERTVMQTSIVERFNPDLLFHAGNAAEFAHEWPLRDPRVHGEPLQYHFFAYGFVAACERVTGVSIPELVLRSQAAVMPCLLVLQVHNLARTFTTRAVGALLGTALVVLHTDLGAGLDRILRIAGSSFRFDSPLEFGLYMSPTTVFGLVVFTTLALALSSWFAAGGGGKRRTLVLIGLVSACASGAKGSMMPVAVAALGVALVVDLARKRPLRRHVAALAVSIVCAAPMTIFLVAGDASYAPAMFHWQPGGMVLARDGAWNRWMRADGFGVVGLLLLPVWMLGHFGASLAGGIRHVITRGRNIATSDVCIVATAAIGFVIAWCLIAPGASQLFFLYPGQVLLAALSGGALVDMFASRTKLDRVLRVPASAALLLGSVAIAFSLRDRVRDDLRERAPATELELEYARGLAWIRANTPARALLLGRHEADFLSGTCARRAIFEGWQYLPKFHALQPGDDAGLARMAETLDPVTRCARRIFAGADEETFACLRARLVGEEVYIVWDAMELKAMPFGARAPVVSPPPPPPATFASNGADLVFDNRAMRVYRLAPR